MSFLLQELKEQNELDKQWAMAKPERSSRNADVGVRSRAEALGAV